MLETMRTGRPRKHDEETVLKAVRVPKSLDQRIQKKADKEQVSWSEIVIKSLMKIFK